jgi:diguanylate cyclase (GGDEF)-like protein
MDLSLPSALAVVGFVFFVAAALLLLSWLQRRDLVPLGLWGMAFALGAAGTVLVAARGQIPDVWSIVAANALIAAGYGTMWNGARLFDGRRPLVWAALAGVAIWLVAMFIPRISGDPAARASMMAAIGIVYTLATAVELWRTRSESLPSRWPAIVLLVLHALSLPSRVPLVAEALGVGPVNLNLLVFITFESMLLAMAGAYLFGSLVHERLVSTFHRAAMVDPLTGAANRRAFLQQGARLLQRAAIEERELSLLLFDIDHFKTINDAHGHTAGDAVLTSFCRVARAQLRPADLFARIGGEEFACLLFDVDAADASRVAERVRFAFEGAVHTANGLSFGATVSAGIATARGSDADLPALLLTADRALYRAKHAGRNRVVEETADHVPEAPLAVRRR